MKRKVFVLMQGMSHKKLYFQKYIFYMGMFSQGSDIRGSQEGGFFYKKNYTFFIVSVRLLISQFIVCYHMTQGFVIFWLKNFLILSFSYSRYYNNISLTIPWGYIIKCLPIPVNQRTLTQFHFHDKSFVFVLYTRQ